MVIYLAGPYTADNSGDVARNVEIAMSHGKDLRERGHFPIIPHLFHHYGLYHKRVTGHYPSYEGMMEWCIKIMEKCDAVAVIDSSPGTDREVRMAKEFGKPIYFLRDKTVSIPSADYQEFHASSTGREDS